MMENELTYWVALTHTPKIWTKRKNEIIVYCFNLGKTIADFFLTFVFAPAPRISQASRSILNPLKAHRA